MEEALEAGQGQPLRGYVEHPDLSLASLRLRLLDFPRRLRAVDEPGRDAVGVQGVNLVLH